MSPNSDNPNQAHCVNYESYLANYTFIQSKEDKNILQNKEYYGQINLFFINNILFYTSLFKELIIVLSEINNLHFKDIIFFKQLLGKKN